MKKLVSVIIPVFNSEKYLQRCLDSLFAQSHQYFEIIIVNDGSTDQSETIIQGYLNSDQRIKYLSQKNAGVSSARNQGIEQATGDYLIFVDADDWLPATALEQMVQVFSQDVDIVVGGYQEYLGTDQSMIVHDFDQVDFADKQAVISRVLLGTGGTIAAKMFSKHLFTDYQIRFDEDVKMCEDQLVVLQLMLHAKGFVSLPEVLYCYNRTNEAGTTARYTVSHLSEQYQVQKRLAEILQRVDHITRDQLLLERFFLHVNGCFLSVVSNDERPITAIKTAISAQAFYQYLGDFQPRSKKNQLCLLAIRTKIPIFIYSIYKLRVLLQLRK